MGERALSELYHKNIEQYLLNWVHIYSNLKKDPRLTKMEYRQVCRRIGGVFCELYEEYKKQRKWKLSFETLFQSIADDPGIRAVMRATLHATGAANAIGKIRGMNRSHLTFRRSESEKYKV